MDQGFRLDFTNRALADLLAVRRWLTQDGSGLRARLRLARINRAIVELQFAPLRWPMDDRPDTRRRSVESHTILYRIDEVRAVILILRVFGPYQDRPAA